MANLRSKYKKKKSKIEDLRKKQQEENKLIGSSGKSDRLEFEDGKTCKFKIMPAKEDDFYILRRQCWVTLEDEDGDEIRRTVPNAKLHGGFKRDLIEEYIERVKTEVRDKEKLKALKDWKNGLSFDNEWIAYAVKIKNKERNFGFLEFKKTVRDGLNKEMFVEDEDDPITTDPFTDPDDGYPILVHYNSKPNKKKGEDYYDLKLAKKPLKTTDEELEKLDKSKSLEELFRNNYTIEDFNNALEGIKIFDEKNEIDLFEDEDWLAEAEEIENEVKEGLKSSNSKDEEAEDTEEEPEDYEEEAEDTEEEPEEEEEGDELDDMDRKQLKKYIKENGFETKVKKSMSDDDIRDAIREEAEEEEDDDEEAEEEEESGETSIEAIRARLAEKSKK